MKSSKLRVAVFSLLPQGDLLFPMFDSYGDMRAFSREYAIVRDGEEKRYFDTYTDEQIVRFEYTGAGWQEISRAGNALGKIPVVYASQGESEWADVQGIIERLEKLLSNFADTRTIIIPRRRYS